MKMAKKKQDDAFNLDNILFMCRDILRQARYSGSFFEKRDMMLTLVFLRFIGEKFEATPHKARPTAWRHICLHLHHQLCAVLP